MVKLHVHVSLIQRRLYLYNKVLVAMNSEKMLSFLVDAFQTQFP